MENELKKVDFGKCREELSKGSDKFKPKQGSCFVKILEDPVESVFLDESGKGTPQIKLKVVVDGKELVWYVTKGLTNKSLYGQLIALGFGEGTLAGKTIQLLVKTSKNKDNKDQNDYTIVEAMKYLQVPGEEKVA